MKLNAYPWWDIISITQERLICPLFVCRRSAPCEKKSIVLSLSAEDLHHVKKINCPLFVCRRSAPCEENQLSSLCLQKICTMWRKSFVLSLSAEDLHYVKKIICPLFVCRRSAPCEKNHLSSLCLQKICTMWKKSFVLSLSAEDLQTMWRKSIVLSLSAEDLHHVKKIKLHGVKTTGDDGLSYLSYVTDSLTDLEISSCPMITEKGLAHLVLLS